MTQPFFVTISFLAADTVDVRSDYINSIKATTVDVVIFAQSIKLFYYCRVGV